LKRVGYSGHVEQESNAPRRQCLDLLGNEWHGFVIIKRESHLSLIVNRVEHPARQMLEPSSLSKRAYLGALERRCVTRHYVNADRDIDIGTKAV
jgi:hypothetical protein